MEQAFSNFKSSKLKKFEPIKSTTNLKCEKCGRTYTLHEFKNGYTYKDGCDCAMIEQAKKTHERKAIMAAFSNSTHDESIKDATVNNYRPQNESQKYAKETAIEYVTNFSLDNPRTIIYQGSYGTGKSHLAFAITKALRDKGYKVAFMHIPDLMDRIKNTYNKNSLQSTDELIEELSNLDLLVLDDVGVEDTQHTLGKLFSIVNKRQNMNNIYTTNFTKQQLQRTQDWERISTRMNKNARPVRLVGDDWRETASW